jgi:hypothetical protein
MSGLRPGPLAILTTLAVKIAGPFLVAATLALRFGRVANGVAQGEISGAFRDWLNRPAEQAMADVMLD